MMASADLGGIGGVDELPELAAEQRFAAAVETAGDDRDAAGQRFEEDEAEAFAAARHHVHVGEVVEIRFLLLGEESGEDDAIGDAELARFALQARDVVAAAGDDVGNVGVEIGQDFENFVESFVALRGDDAAEGQEHALAFEV